MSCVPLPNKQIFCVFKYTCENGFSISKFDGAQWYPYVQKLSVYKEVDISKYEKVKTLDFNYIYGF